MKPTPYQLRHSRAQACQDQVRANIDNHVRRLSQTAHKKLTNLLKSLSDEPDPLVKFIASLAAAALGDSLLRTQTPHPEEPSQ